VRSATGTAKVAKAAPTKKSKASAMRPRYGRRKGSNPLKERTGAVAGVDGIAGVDA
jgi:hypothetical protein